MGFVDFTPKKRRFIEDIILQKALLFDDIDCKIECLEEYTLSDGSTELLTYLDIDPFACKFANCLASQFESIFLVKTPEFEIGCAFPRKRPDSFYIQLKKTNMFIDRIATFSDKIKTIALPVEDDVFHKKCLVFSYDGVHHTELGHKFVFKKIRESILYGTT